jgi:hypothetical protein
MKTSLLNVHFLLALLCVACSTDCKKTTPTQPNTTQPTDAQPTDAQPTDAQPTDAQPTDAQPTDAQPTDAQPTDAQPTDAQPTDAQPTGAQPADVQPDIPLEKIELSMFEKKDKGCVWKRIRPSGAQEKLVAQFPFACKDVRGIAWSPDFMRAVVWLSSEKAFEVDFATGKQKALPSAKKLRGNISYFGISSEGIVALSLKGLDDSFEEKLRKKELKEFKFTWGGKAFAIELPEEDFFPIEGHPALAHAWLLKEGAWQLIESKLTSAGTCLSDGTSVLEASFQLGPARHGVHTPDAYPEEALLKNPALAAWAPKSEDSGEGWAQISVPYGELFLWMDMVGEGMGAFGVLYQLKGKPPAPLPELGFAHGGSAGSPSALHNVWLLAHKWNSETDKEKYFLYDLKSGSLVWSSAWLPTGLGVAFWPSKKGQ